MTISVILILLWCNNIVVAPVHNYIIKTYLARITVYSIYEKGESKINHRGKRIMNSMGCAVPSNSLPDGTIIEIPKYGIKRTVDDRIPQRSVRKHERIASKKNKNIDICIDIRYNIKNKKELMKRDLGYQQIKVYAKEVYK